MVLLSIIGLLFILWYASKGLRRLGNFLDRLGDEMINYSNTKQRPSYTPIKRNVSKLQEKLVAVKETEEDRIFKSDIRKEIDELTGEE